MKNFKLESDETLRIKKFKNFNYAYAREIGSDCWQPRRERYLGRCNSDGSPVKSRKLRNLRSL